MSAQHCHETRVSEKLGTRLLTTFISCLERFVAAVEHRVRHCEILLDGVVLLCSNPMLSLTTASPVHLGLHHLYVLLGYEYCIRMFTWRIAPVSGTLTALLSEASVEAHDYVWTTVLIRHQ